MRKFGAICVAALLLLSMASCSKKSDSDTSASATTAAKSDNNKSDSGGDSDTSTTKKSSSGSGSSDTLPDLNNLGDCVNIGLTYAGIYLSALGLQTDADKQKLQDAIDQVKADLPSDVQDDLQTIADGIQNANGLQGISEFFDSDEYKKADANVTAYLDEKCGTNSNSDSNSDSNS